MVTFIPQIERFSLFTFQWSVTNECSLIAWHRKKKRKWSKKCYWMFRRMERVVSCSEFILHCCRPNVRLAHIFSSSFWHAVRCIASYWISIGIKCQSNVAKQTNEKTNTHNNASISWLLSFRKRAMSCWTPSFSTFKRCTSASRSSANFSSSLILFFTSLCRSAFRTPSWIK